MRLDEITRRLRRECPWDRGQTHHSLARHLIEEAYENPVDIEFTANFGEGEDGEGADEDGEEQDGHGDLRGGDAADPSSVPAKP